MATSNPETALPAARSRFRGLAARVAAGAIAVMIAAVSPQGAQALSPVVVASVPEREWQQLKSGGIGQRISWRIRIDEVSAFGGFFVKGHLAENKKEKVHLVWPAQRKPSVQLRNAPRGLLVTVNGSAEGVTSENEVMIEVTDVVIY